MDGGERRVTTHPSVSSGDGEKDKGALSFLRPPSSKGQQVRGMDFFFFRGGSWDAGAVVGGTKGVYLKTSSGDGLIVNRLLRRKKKCQEKSA